MTWCSMRNLLLVSFALFLGCANAAEPKAEPKAQPKADPFAGWEKEITGIEKRLKDKPPETGGIVFAGGSTIRMWDVAKAFPKLPVVNVGFGGSTVPDVTHFTSRLILPLAPKTIVYYTGDNDLAKGATPEKVGDDFATFVKLIHEKLPKTKILFVSVKPSPRRWALFDKQTKANALVKELIGKDELLAYVDVVPGMLGKDGKPIPDQFVKDELHLSAKGYEVWTAVLSKVLEK